MERSRDEDAWSSGGSPCQPPLLMPPAKAAPLIAHWWSDSEVRIIVPHPRLRTSESRTTSNSMIVVPLLNPKFAIAFAARCARTSGSGH